MFNKKLKAQLTLANQKIEELTRENDDQKMLLLAYRDKKIAKLLLAECAGECSTSDRGRKCWALLCRTTNEINYRDYITKTQSGRIVLDPLQIFLSNDEIEQLLSKE